MNNTRIWEAARAIAIGGGDARSRVVIACRILDKLSPHERRSLPLHVEESLARLLKDAASKGSMTNNATGAILRDKYDNTSRNRKNRTYEMHAVSIFRMNEEINNDRF